ncbi:hypothetical protein E3N88_08972 [Mikania micrantha]|uniref:CCR4-NOT transcription complex subunit 9 n=1 Tax=Mikania micrantha TaxID=192012 RepID=A0A5N6PK19_9ASTR|nr:hypothetical protein E3N88_08972 [Mikania micrantha]
MENLPETLYIDPTDECPTAGAESVERARIDRFIQLLYEPLLIEEALSLLNKERLRSNDIALVLWNSKDVPFILLQEISKAYTLLSPPTLISMKEATRVCNALALIQAMASHPDTKIQMVRAQLPVYIYPFLNTCEKGIKQLDYLRLTSLGVMGALVKVDDANSPEIIHFLLETEVVPLCLRCIEMGGELAKTVSVIVISKILLYEEGQRYCGTFPERFYVISHALANIVNQFHGKPSLQLLKHILTCFLILSEVSRASDALTKCYPARLRDSVYLNFVCGNVSVRRLADQVLQNLTDHR